MRVRFDKGPVLLKYNGMDGDRPLHLNPGDETDVSEEKGQDLLDSFPFNFSRVDLAPIAEHIEPSPEPEPETKMIDQAPQNKMVSAPAFKRGWGHKRR